MLDKLNTKERPALMSPVAQAADASVQVGYNPLRFSHTTICIVATGASFGTLARVAVVCATLPAAAPVRNVVIPAAGINSDSSRFAPGALNNWANVVAASVAPFSPGLGRVPQSTTPAGLSLVPFPKKHKSAR